MSERASERTVRIDHVGLDVRDLDAQIGLSRAAFDLEVEWRERLDTYDFTMVFLLHPSGWRLELFHRDEATPSAALDPGTQHDRLGYGHVAYTCWSADQVRAVHDRLVGLGAASHIPPSPSPAPERLFDYLVDPEGNLLELVGRG